MSMHLGSPVVAFAGSRRVASGRLADVALAVRAEQVVGLHGVVVFCCETGVVVDLDLRGTETDVMDRLSRRFPDPPANDVDGPDADEEDLQAGRPSPRGRGRPFLGVVAREVTLLPRHWDWLSSRPGGASVALRRLVDEARRAHADRDRSQAATEAAYRFMSAVAGDYAHFEEASRALFAGDLERMDWLVGSWPPDVAEEVRRYVARIRSA